MFRHGHGEGALRRHRFSESGASYFLTLCTEARRSGLNTTSIADALRAEITAIQTSGHWRLRAAAIMPDHVHLLVRLDGTLPLSKCVGRLKSKTKPQLVAAGIDWQANFFEHRMRPDEAVAPVLRYLLQNPARAGICTLEDTSGYPWFWLGDDEKAWFEPTTDKGAPFPEWLA